MNLFDILSMDERVLVHSDVGERTIITWNRSLTLQLWTKVIDPYQLSGYEDTEDNWREVNVQVLSEEPDNYEAARQAAIRWTHSHSEE